jgi:HSP20 family molecular chaperone IbpA
MTTFISERHISPFDLLFKDFFRSELNFQPAIEAKIPHPVDIYENKDGLHFEIACTGLDKNGVGINIEGDIIKVSYNKSEDDKCCDVNDCTFLHKGIARRSFNLGYKVASKFSLPEASAEMKNGLLKISVPYAEEAKPKALKIK